MRTLGTARARANLRNFSTSRRSIARRVRHRRRRLCADAAALPLEFFAVPVQPRPWTRPIAARPQLRRRRAAVDGSSASPAGSPDQRVKPARERARRRCAANLSGSSPASSPLAAAADASRSAAERGVAALGSNSWALPVAGRAVAAAARQRPAHRAVGARALVPRAPACAGLEVIGATLPGLPGACSARRPRRLETRRALRYARPLRERGAPAGPLVSRSDTSASASEAESPRPCACASAQRPNRVRCDRPSACAMPPQPAGGAPMAAEPGDQALRFALCRAQHDRRELIEAARDLHAPRKTSSPPSDGASPTSSRRVPLRAADDELRRLVPCRAGRRARRAAVCRSRHCRRRAIPPQQHRHRERRRQRQRVTRACG